MGIGIILKGLKNKFNELMGRDTKEDKDKKLSEGGSTPQASSDQASAAPAPSGEQKEVPKDLIKRYSLSSPEGHETQPDEPDGLTKELVGDFSTRIKDVKDKKEYLEEIARRVPKGFAKDERSRFAYVVQEFLKKLGAYVEKTEINVEEVRTMNNEKYRNLIEGMFALIPKDLGQTTPAENTAPSAKQPSAGSRPPMPLPPSNVATNQTQRPGGLSPHSLPQNFSDPECQKQVIEKSLKTEWNNLIEKAKEKKLLNDYNYDENIKCYGFDYPACNFLENVRVFWLKIAEIMKIPPDDISYKIIKFQNEIGNCLQKTEFQSLLSTEDFVTKSKSFLDDIKKKINEVGGEKLLEDKKNELIESKGGTLNKLLSKFNELYKDDEYKHEQFEYKPKQFKEKESLDELQRSIEVFWLALKAKFGQGEKYKERAEKLDAKMKKFDSTIEYNREMSTLEAINNVGEALDQKFNIIGRVVLYLEKRKNKENEKDKEKGFFGKLFGKSKKSDKEDKKQKKEKLNDQKRLKKCFEDMGKYFVKNKDEVSATGLRKLVKNNDIDTYIEWNNSLRILLARNSISFNKELLMSALFISFIDLGDKESVIAACDGLKSGGIKSIDPKSFEGKATSIRKEIKGKCATLDMAKDKDDLKNYIKTLCKKYFGLDMSTLSLIGNIFGN